jgi:DNA-binding HxlR family transcriptional regulator
LLHFKGGVHVNKLSKYKICGDVETTLTGKILYLILNDLSNRNGEVTIPQRKISEALKISKQAVSRNLHRLERVGAITIIPTYHSDGGRAANKYIVK